jgi:hypothetical protein
MAGETTPFGPRYVSVVDGCVVVVEDEEVEVVVVVVVPADANALKSPRTSVPPAAKTRTERGHAAARCFVFVTQPSRCLEENRDFVSECSYGVRAKK